MLVPIRPILTHPKFLFSVLLILFLGSVLYLYRGFIPDDTYIHAGFAKDIASGKGYSFAGNKTYGSTSPLWPPLIAIASMPGFPYESAAQVLSLVFALGAILLVYSVVQEKWGVPEAWAAVIVFAGNAYFLRWAMTGMEASASSFYMLILLVLLFREKNRIRGLYLYAILGLAPLIRPEFYLFLFLYFGYLFLTKNLTNISAKIALTSIPSILWNLFALFYFGTITPSTFSIKAGNTFFSTEWVTILRSTKLLLSANSIELLTITACVLVLVRIQGKQLWKRRRELLQSEFMLLAAWILSFYFYYNLKNVTILSRYALVLLPVVILLAIHLLVSVSDQRRMSPKKKNLLLAGFVTVSLVVQILFTIKYVKPDADNFVQGFQKEYSIIAERLSREIQSGGAVAVSDVGIIGTYSGLKVCDFVGLVDKDRFRYSSNREYFINKRPSYLIHRNEFPLSDLLDPSFTLHSMYEANFHGLGINQQYPVAVHVYKVQWR